MSLMEFLFECYAWRYIKDSLVLSPKARRNCLAKIHGVVGLVHQGWLVPCHLEDVSILPCCPLRHT